LFRRANANNEQTIISDGEALAFQPQVPLRSPALLARAKQAEILTFQRAIYILKRILIAYGSQPTKSSITSHPFAWLAFTWLKEFKFI